MKTATLPHEIKAALETMLDYLGDSERRDYDASPATGRKQHIYRSVIIARNWLDHQNSAPTLLDACKAARELAYTLGDRDTQESCELFEIYMLCDEAIRQAETAK